MMDQLARRDGPEKSNEDDDRGLPGRACVRMWTRARPWASVGGCVLTGARQVPGPRRRAAKEGGCREFSARTL